MAHQTLSHRHIRPRDPALEDVPGTWAAVALAAGKSLEILAADPDITTRSFYRAALPRLGHKVQVVKTGPELVEACRVLRPDVVLAASKLPELDGLAAIDAVCRARPVPAVLVADSLEPLVVARVLASDWVMASLSRPVAEDALGAAVALAARRFGQLHGARIEAIELKQALEDRKVIERAKGALSRRARLPEDEAYLRMRTLASNTNRKLIEVARQIIAAEAAFAELDRS
jgi:AmiR/NasT family two-component response regulator